MKLTLLLPEKENVRLMARRLGSERVIACEYADAEYIVFMATPENDSADYGRLVQALGVNHSPYLQRKKCVRYMRGTVYGPRGVFCAA